MGPTGTNGWTQGHTTAVDVSTGPSGLSTLSCTDNGSGDGTTLQSSSGDSYVSTVALSAGANQINCNGANGDGNGALVGNSGTELYQQDSTVPSISFTDGGYTAATWTALQQTVQVTASGGASGISNLTCTLDGKVLPDSNGDTETLEAPAGTKQTAYVTVPANGAHSLRCGAENSGTPSIVGSGSYQIDIDSQIPVTTFETGSGFAATSTQAADPETASGQNWINGQTSTITVGVSGTELTIDSGVQSTTCTINGYTTSPIVLTNTPTSGTIAQATPFAATFAANPKNGWIDGQNKIVCDSDSLAGLVGADGAAAATSSIEYIDVNDPSWPVRVGGNLLPPSPGQCGISSVIDNGGCAYSNGPSQTTWYSTSQTVQIQADDTGAAAPITSITCSGASMTVSSWTASADPQDVDSNNGMTVTATIKAPGGKIDCSASDSASPADSYELGTYNVSIDASTPRGAFEAQGYEGAAKNIIQIDISSTDPSGIKSVAVTARDVTSGTTYTASELTDNPADGSTAYATLDQNTGTWNLTVDPQIFPGADDKIALTATAVTNAGVAGTISTAQDGSTETVTPAQLGQVQVAPALAPPWYSVSGDATAITATATAGKWEAAGTSQAQLFASLSGTAANPIAPTKVDTTAKLEDKVCDTAAKKGMSDRSKSARTKAQRSCHTLIRTAPKWEALPANYDQSETISGVLTDTKTNTPIARAKIRIYTTSFATNNVRRVGTARTDAKGRFSYKLAAGPDRRVDLVYVGASTTRHGADTAFDTTSAGAVHVHAAQMVRVGQHMRITGRIRGGSIAAKGALVQMQYEIPKDKIGWQPFEPGRSNTKGGFVVRYPIGRGSAGLTYRVRFKVPTQAGWGYRGTTSNVLRFHVA
jgi:hypothetical protein